MTETKTPTIEGPFIYLAIDDADRSCKRWRLYLVKTEDGEIKNYRDSDPWDDFVITAYFQEAERIRKDRAAEGAEAYDRANREPVFGYFAGYERPYHVDLETAERMAKTLRAIDKSLERQRQQYGYGSTFMDFVMRIAVAVKAKGFVRCTSNRGGWSYSDSSHDWLDSQQARHYIDREHWKYIKQAIGEAVDDAAA